MIKFTNYDLGRELSKILVTLSLFIRHLIDEAMNWGGGKGAYVGGN